MKIRVNIRDTTDGPVGSGGTSTIVEMPAVPRVDDMVFADEDSGGMTVKTVLWTP
jgi:hypothetical protein